MFFMGMYVGDQGFSSDEEEFCFFAKEIQEIKSSPDFDPVDPEFDLVDRQARIELLAYYEPLLLAVMDKIRAKMEIPAEPYGLMTPVSARRESVLQDAEGTYQFNPAAHPKQIEMGVPGPDFEDSGFDQAFEEAASAKGEERKLKDRMMRTPEQNKAHDEEEAIRENMRQKIQSIKDSHKKENPGVLSRTGEVAMVQPALTGHIPQKNSIGPYVGQKQIVAAFVAHGKKVTMRQIRNYFHDGLEHDYLEKGKRKSPRVTDSAITEYLYNDCLNKIRK